MSRVVHIKATVNDSVVDTPEAMDRLLADFERAVDDVYCDNAADDDPHRFDVWFMDVEEEDESAVDPLTDEEVAQLASFAHYCLTDVMDCYRDLSVLDYARHYMDDRVLEHVLYPGATARDDEEEDESVVDPLTDEARSEILTVGQLREVLAQPWITDECRISVVLDRCVMLKPVRVWDQASDAYPTPYGTDPSEEDTVSVLIFEVTR